MSSYPFDYRLSVIIPVFNDEEVLPELHRRLHAALTGLSPEWEIIFIDDGSSDGSIEVLRLIQSDHEGVIVLQLTRNFGQPNAIAAGLDHAKGDVIVLMDSDLQDRPEDIENLLSSMEQAQAPMAIACWSHREDDEFKVAASNVFNAIANNITSVPHQPRTRVFRAMKRDLVEAIKEASETTATPLSILSWMAYDHTLVSLERDARYAGASGYTLGRMIKLSLDRIFSYSLLPIRLASIFGVILGLISILLAIYLVLQKLFFQSILPGWTSIVVIVLFLLGMNFIFIGILGEYLGRIYLEVKKRPRYVIKKMFGRENHQV